MAGLFVAMKARSGIAVIFLLTLCVTLCGCSVSFPLQGIEIPIQPQVTYRIYVSGAVERDGYYEVSAETSYVSLFQLAGLLPETVLPEFYTNLIDGNITKIILDYYDGEAVRYSINVNSPLIANRIPVKGLSQDVIDKLADYIDQYGAIRNRQQLSEALGDDYADNYYRLYIAEEDYEKVD